MVPSPSLKQSIKKNINSHTHTHAHSSSKYEPPLKKARRNVNNNTIINSTNNSNHIKKKNNVNVNTSTPQSAHSTVPQLIPPSPLQSYILSFRTPSPSPKLRRNASLSSIEPVAPNSHCLLGQPTQEILLTTASSFIPPGGGQWKKPEWLISAVTRDLEELSHTNMKMLLLLQVQSKSHIISDRYKVFFSQHEQPFSMDFYVTRLSKYFTCSTSAFVAALVYLDRVHVRCPSLALVEMNSHRLLATALLLAVKYLDDQVCTNSYYAKVAGLATSELNSLEQVMLDVLDWRLAISPELFTRYERSLLDVAVVHDCEGSSPVSTRAD